MLTIIPNGNATKVADILRRVCPDPALQIDLSTVTLDDPDGGTSSIVSSSGKVTYTASPSASATCRRVSFLVNSDADVTIEMVPGSTEIGDRRMDTRESVTFSSGLRFINESFGRIQIVLDESNGGGAGYWVQGLKGVKLDMPIDVALAHEFGHAEATIGNALLIGDEKIATDAENAYRSERALPLRDRDIYEGGLNGLTSSTTTTKPKKTPPSSGGCFSVLLLFPFHIIFKLINSGINAFATISSTNSLTKQLTEETTRMAGVFGPNEATEGDPVFMYVAITNAGGPLDEIAFTYQRTDMSIPVMIVRKTPLLEGRTALFCMGLATRVAHFSFTGYANNNEVMLFQGVPLNDPFIQTHIISPNTIQMFYYPSNPIG